MNVHLLVGYALEGEHGLLRYRVAHLLRLALEIAKSTILAHLVQVRGQVLLDLGHDHEIEQIELGRYTSPLGTILLQTTNGRGTRTGSHCQDAK